MSCTRLRSSFWYNDCAETTVVQQSFTHADMSAHRTAAANLGQNWFKIFPKQAVIITIHAYEAASEPTTVVLVLVQQWCMLCGRRTRTLMYWHAMQVHLQTAAGTGQNGFNFYKESIPRLYNYE